MILQTLELFPVHIVQIVFACQVGFISILIWNQERYRSLAVFFIFQAILSVMNVLEGANTTTEYYLVTPVFTLVIGPMLYFFIRSLVNDVAMTTKQKIVHFVAALIALPFTHYVQLIVAFGTLSQLIYLAHSFRVIARYHKTANAVSSDADRYKLNWLLKALFIFAFVTIADLIRMNLQTFTSDFVAMLWYFINEVIFMSLSCYLGFKIIRQPQLFVGMTSYEKLVEHEESGDNQEEQALAQRIFANIENHILQDAMFKKPRLTVTDISQSTGISVKDISWAINLGCNRNFCDYINSLRIMNVKKKLLAGDSRNTSLLDIALASGFNSKSTFNAVFKKELGKTPSQFIRDELKPTTTP
ncbi:AraC family transcriptional regulator [Colwellia sp. RSH04]|uniref:helix-turn-helix domain-containing protein n=1 Tax=Colwellia sp. RSH04 TaxID=2305464 RepID=UPI000E57134F|nr:helix-turn-helix domain-containing protein [Colwellia sp. RSH04]RHW74942.1 AraC family transcriptional regulator [Colwellia sp. RSH04]